MGKIWLKSVDPNRQCCGCEGKTSPCDSCCNYIISGDLVFSSLPSSTQVLQSTLKDCKLYVENIPKNNIIYSSDLSGLNFQFETPFYFDSLLQVAKTVQIYNTGLISTFRDGEFTSEDAPEYPNIAVDCEVKKLYNFTYNPIELSALINLEKINGDFSIINQNKEVVIPPGIGNTGERIEIDLISGSQEMERFFLSRRFCNTTELRSNPAIFSGYGTGTKQVPCSWYRTSITETQYNYIDSLPEDSQSNFLSTLNISEDYDSSSVGFGGFVVKGNFSANGNVSIIKGKRSESSYVPLSYPEEPSSNFIQVSYSSTHTNTIHPGAFVGGNFSVVNSNGLVIFSVPIPNAAGSTNIVNGNVFVKVSDSIGLCDQPFRIGWALGGVISFVGYIFAAGTSNANVFLPGFCECISQTQEEDIFSNISGALNGYCKTYEFNIESSKELDICPVFESAYGSDIISGSKLFLEKGILKEIAFNLPEGSGLENSENIIIPTLNTSTYKTNQSSCIKYTFYDRTDSLSDQTYLKIDSSNFNESYLTNVYSTRKQAISSYIDSSANGSIVENKRTNLLKGSSYFRSGDRAILNRCSI